MHSDAVGQEITLGSLIGTAERFHARTEADGCFEVSTNPGPVTPPFEPLTAQNEPDAQATS